MTEGPLPLEPEDDWWKLEEDDDEFFVRPSEEHPYQGHQAGGERP